MTFFAVRYAASPPDAEHRFGHGKAEAFASLIQAGLVFASAALIGQEAILHLISPGRVENEGWGIAVMLLSIVMTGGLIAAQSYLLRRTASLAVSADRTHYAADLASNVIALAGVAAVAAFHLISLDALAGLAVGAILLWGAISVFRESSGQLMDRELSDTARARIIALVTEARASPMCTSCAPVRQVPSYTCRCTPIWIRISPWWRPIRPSWPLKNAFCASSLWPT